MKQIDRMSRLTCELEKLFRTLNMEIFDGQLDTPVITVTPSSRSYAHYTPWDAWSAGDAQRREINIASGTLDRPLENIICSLVHEMCHMYNDTILHVSDVSRGTTYHNRRFKETAEAAGLIVSRSEKYGWSHTEPGPVILDFVLLHDEFREIEMCRNSSAPSVIGIGIHTGNSTGLTLTGGNPNSHSRKYLCLGCRNSVRATKAVNIICADCMQPMIAV